MAKNLFLTTSSSFDAAHKLIGYDGQCANLHGHRWTVEVTVGPFNPEADLDSVGIAVDFKKVKKALASLEDLVDHQFLNEVPFLIGSNPTAEILVTKFMGYLQQLLQDIPVHRVRVYESPESYAELEWV